MIDVELQAVQVKAYDASMTKIQPQVARASSNSQIFIACTHDVQVFIGPCTGHFQNLAKYTMMMDPESDYQC